MDYLQRKGCQYKENAEEYIVRECMFCPKPHYNKADNLYKLSRIVPSFICRYISKKTGAFICHRCGACGSWFDFKRMQGDLQDDQTSQVVSIPRADSTKQESQESNSQIHQFAYNTVKEYIANLRDKVYPAV